MCGTAVAQHCLVEAELTGAGLLTLLTCTAPGDAGIFLREHLLKFPAPKVSKGQLHEHVQVIRVKAAAGCAACTREKTQRPPSPSQNRDRGVLANTLPLRKSCSG